MTEFTKYVLHIIKNIPYGYVMTYGQIARLAGSPRGARQVSRILHSMSRKHQLPWHRVVNAQGKITIKDEGLRNIQKLELETEGVFVSGFGFQVDLKIYRYEPN